MSAADTHRTRAAWFAVAAVWGLLCAASAVADDTEIFVGASDLRPNVLFVVDTSGSMDTLVQTQPDYDPATQYPGSCDPQRVYYGGVDENPPPCDTDQWVSRSDFVCAAALQAFQSAGYLQDRYGMFVNGNEPHWDALSSDRHQGLVECASDYGKHGDGSSDQALWPQDGDGSAPFTSDPSNAVQWGQAPLTRGYIFYDGNALNWAFGPTQALKTRLQIVQSVTDNLLDSVSGINVGLMRFNNFEGGAVIHAMENIDSARASMEAKLNALTPSGATPLSETLYEAGLYFRGGLVDYGNVGDPDTSVADSRAPGDPSRYQSPLAASCQKNFLVLLTDGAPVEDSSADNKITALPGFADAVGNTCDGSGEGHCLDDMAAYLHNADLSASLPQQQSVNTYTVGFAVDLPLLQSTATRGGGSYYLANDTESLASVLNNIVTDIQKDQLTFTAPSVPVDTFNRIQNQNTVYVTVFQPTDRVRWPGNLKKYQLNNGQLTGRDGQPVVDPATGYFRDGAQSLWADMPDGAQVTTGGAANQLPAWNNRRLYTYFGTADLTTASNRVALANNNISDSFLGLGNGAGVSRDQLLRWVLGADVKDENNNGDVNETRHVWGDPLHASPVTVVYGGSPSSPDISDAVVFSATNEGELHAVDAVTGEELWSFIPPQFLADMLGSYNNGVTSVKHYGIDGNLRVQVSETVQRDGIIENGEKVYLYFGLRRGGDKYFALDVSDKTRPKLLWQLGPGDLPGLGQTWSTPVPTRVAVSGRAQNDRQQVLIFGGGYDPSQDNVGYSQDAAGNGIYMVDAESGALLWHAARSGADLNLDAMRNSFPADITVVDLDANGLADRMYAADTGGQIWRFDIFNGQNPGSLVTGGVLASLGGAAAADTPDADNRRFYYAPDVALIQGDDNRSFINIGIGSGHRAHPLGTATHDRFYALRDYNAFNALSQARYDATTPVTDADLVDITDNVDAAVPVGAPGWRLELRSGGWQGEKVLAPSRTFANRIFFTTFTPSASPDGCAPSAGVNRLYAVNVVNGAPVNNLDSVGSDLVFTVSDRSTELAQGGIAPEVNFVFPPPPNPDSCQGDACQPEPVACVGLECFDPNVPNQPVRTYWTQDNGG